VRIAFVSAERVPLVKVGGLGDVAAALTDVLAERGHDVDCFLPDYASLTMPAGATRVPALDVFPVPLGDRDELCAVHRLTLPGSKAAIYLVDHAGARAYFQREGVYGDPATGEEYPDNAERFLFFCRAVCESLKRLGRRPDIVHLNDYQTSFVAAALKTVYAADPFFHRNGIAFTAHNVGYQGIYPPSVLARAGLPRAGVAPGSPFEFYGKLNFLKVGLEFSDMLTTVSPRYAKEIQTTAEYGHGLEGVFRARAADLVGILNGIDTKVWNPETDPAIAARYSVADLSGKAACRAALAREAGWPEDSDWPIVGIVSRLAGQKGFDLLEEAEDDLAKLEMRLIVLGSGERRYHDLFARWMKERPESVHAVFGFDEPLSHRIEAGADLFLMPSRYEPCGLNQMMSLRYGTVPVVRATGGLADTVHEFDPASGKGNGFSFEPYEVDALVASLKRALATYRQRQVWRRVQANGMAEDFSWDASAQKYEEVYAEAARKAQSGRTT
jgi:starch synthase